MEKLSAFLKYSQTYTVLGLTLILSSFFDISGSSFLGIKIKMGIGVFLLGIFHVLKAITLLIEPEE